MSGEYLDEERRLLPLPEDAAPKVAKMFYTSCPVCGPVNDWTDTYPDARASVKAHTAAHKRRAYVPLPIS